MRFIFKLKPQFVNLGAVDRTLVVGEPQALANNLDGGVRLYRIGDAVSARYAHAVICDTLRLVKDI